VGVRSPERDETFLPEPTAAPLGPPLSSFVAVVLGLFVVLVSNGRPIGAGDTRPTERVAASLVQQGNFDLDEYPEVEPPFARETGGHRLSIYPVLSAVLAAPVFAAARALFVLDETGTALAGKLAASLLSALAAGVLFLSVGQRHAGDDATGTAMVFALGTSVWSTSQALWQHPAAVLFLSIAILFMLKAEYEPVWGGRAGLPLALAVAARHADVALVGVLALGFVLRWPRRLPWLLVWAAPAVAFVLLYQWAYFGSPLRHGFTGRLDGFSEPWGVGHLGLLVSPAKGLLVFTPVVLVAVVGLARAFLRGERALAATLGAAALAHFVLMGRWKEWHGGECWGPRLLTDALPLAFVFLPEGAAVLKGLAVLLAAVSIGVQALGAFAYDYRWERLYEREPQTASRALWDVARSPIPFHLEERVLIFAMPGVRSKKAFVREHRVVVAAPSGSRVSFAGEGPVVSGAEAVFGDVHLLRGARVDGDRLRLRGRWDGLFLRVRPGARARRLELRIAGNGRGTLYVGERTFWSDAPSWTAYPMTGEVRARHPYYYPESGGADVTITLGRAQGEADLVSIALVPPSEPENPIRLGKVD
jgi:hypothetical protein